MTLSEEKLELAHKQEFAQLVRAVNAPFSEYCFANLYLFRTQHDYRILRRDGLMFLQGITYDGERYVMPLFPLSAGNETILREVMAEGFSLFPVAASDLSIFPESIYSYSFNVGDSDYVYKRERIATYPGRYLHKKRNLVKQYRTYAHRDEPYSCAGERDALTILDEWLRLSENPVEDTDYEVCREALLRCDEMGLKGQIYYADAGSGEKPSGLLLGEELNDNTFVLHFAKGNISFKGIYAHMYMSLAESQQLAKYDFLNFEQDLGKEGLKQAKSTYITDIMNDKYRVRLK
ncbi:DUF2156 domain-containing protein [Deferribacterales bacterium RsTz2092]|nr:hypothetical protein AGMMS49941_01250 [Deferribacterales bacterium]